MSFARSASVPGLSINTGAANSLGSQSSQPQAPGSLSTLGTNGTTSTAQGTGTMSLFGNAQTKPGTGLFGNANAQPTTSTATGGGLFGQSMSNPQNQGSGATSAGGLFGGNTASNDPKPQSAGGLFGKPTTGAASGGLFGAAGTQASQQQQQPAQNQAQTGSSLFGAANKPQQTTTQSTGGGGLFGASINQNQQPGQQVSGTGLFGNNNSNTQQPSASGTSGGGLFGQPAQQATGGGLFGASTTNNNQTTAGGSGLFPQSQAQASTGFLQMQGGQNQPAKQSISAVQINYDTLRPRSRFDDLAQPLQDDITNMDKKIQTWMKMKDDISEFMPQHERDIEQLGRDVKYVENKFKAVQAALNSDIQTVKALQDTTKKNIADAQLSFKAADNLKLPSHYHQSGLFATSAPPTSNTRAADASSPHDNAQDLITYFNRICDDVEKYKRRLDEYHGAIERDMPGVENGLYEQIRAFRERNAGGNGAVQDQLGQVLLALKETGTAIVNQAGQIADTRERLSRLQAGMYDGGIYSTSIAV